MKVVLLTTIQKDQLKGHQYASDCYFNPILDGNTPANWVISTEEQTNCINPDFEWVKTLPLIDFVSPIYPPII